MFRLLNICRACGNSGLKEVFHFDQPMPLANSFRLPGEEQEGYVPLTILFCPQCSLSQLREVVNPSVLYSGYPYTTSRSETMQAHFKNLWSAIKEECEPAHVLEIGSNDGHFLQFCKANGAESVVGIDPAENLKPDPDESGIISICGLFDSETAAIARGAMPSVDVIVARHVFAHVDDWHGFIKCLDVLANKDTLIVIEVPYVLDLLENIQLDTIYHEHLSYVSLKAVRALLESTPFHIHGARRFPVHGGALVLMLRRNDCAKYPLPLPRENIAESHWEDFRNYANTSIRALRFKVHELVGRKTTVCGYGASAKSTVWISACGFTRNDIQFICDCTPHKQGRLSPGTDIPIVPESELMEKMPDHAVLWSWNYREEIIKKHKKYLLAGGKFIVPGKRVEIV